MSRMRTWRLTDANILRLAVSRHRNDAGLARALQRSATAVSQWRKKGALPFLIRRVLTLELGLSEGGQGKPWMAKEFQERNTGAKALQQLFALFDKTKGRGAHWLRAQRVLAREDHLRAERARNQKRRRASPKPPPQAGGG